MREYFTPQRSVFPSYLTVESGRMCRLCILQLIQWKDIKRLPAPGRLIRYLELGNISSDHVVHNVL